MKKSALIILLCCVISAIFAGCRNQTVAQEPTSQANDEIKSFSDIVPNSELFESCQIICTDGAKVLTNNELSALVSELEQLQYYNRGSYDNVMEGNVYIAFFTSQQTGTVEVHISDVDSREPFRQISYAGLACRKTIKGHGLNGYREAILHLKELLNTAQN